MNKALSTVEYNGQEVDVEYDWSPGEVGNYWEPDVPPEIQIIKVTDQIGNELPYEEEEIIELLQERIDE